MKKRIVLSGVFVFWSALAWSVDASGFTLTKPCGTPPFASGDTDMALHLTHFPKQKAGQELVILMPSLLGPSGVKDWMRAEAKLCSTPDAASCTNAEKARVRVVSFSRRNYRTTGRFEISFGDGSTIEGSFTAKERLQSGPLEPVICE
jgi:hypothetical protein